MKLFHKLHALSLLVIPLFLASVSNIAMADQRDHRFNNRFNNDHHYNERWGRRDFGRSNTRFNTRNGNYRSGRHHDNWSVSLNLGSAWYGSGYGRSMYYSSGISPYYGSSFYNSYRYSPFPSRTTVVYRQPRVVYVNNPAPVTTRVIRSTPVARPERSLLRDLDGNCFERNFDDLGNEIRTQLPASACNF